MWTLGGRYDWRLRRTEAGWRISDLTLTVLWGDGNQRIMDLATERGAATDIVERFFLSLEVMDVEAFLDVWAEDGVQEMPFAPEGFPRRLEDKEAIRRQYGGLPEAYSAMRFPRHLRPAVEPDVVIAEYRGEISLRSGGRYDNRYVGIFEVRNGLLQRFTEYFDPNVLATAFGDRLQDTFSLPEDS